MRRLKGYGPLIAVTVMGLLLLILSETIAKWLADNRSAHNGAVIGRVMHVEGSVRRIHGADIDLLPTPDIKPIDLRDGDRLQTSVQSKADVILNSLDELEVPSGTVAGFELWNAHDTASPIYVSTSLGQVNWQHPGVRGKAYLIKDGKLYFPGQKPVAKAMALTVLHAAPLDMHLASSEAPPGDFEADPAAGAAAADENKAPAGAEPETLANEYIDEMIVSHQAQLQKCWLTRLKDSPGLAGQITVQFEISHRGKVKEAHVADSTLQDETLKKCVVSVIERVPFRSYKGSEISLSYPIKFE